MDKIVAMRAGFAGDVVLSTGILNGVKKTHPDIPLVYLTKDSYFDLVRWHPAVDVVTSNTNVVTPAAAYWEISQEKFGAANTAVGSQPTSDMYWAEMLAHQAVSLGLLNIDLMDDDFRPCLYVSKKDLARVPKMDEFVVAFSSYSFNGRYSKLWYIDRWEWLAQDLRGLGCRVLQVGVANEPRIRGTEDLRGRTTLGVALALLTRIDMLVTIDNFWMHAAVGKLFAADSGELLRDMIPSVVLLGPTVASGLLPIGYQSNPDEAQIVVITDPKHAECPCWHAVRGAPCGHMGDCMDVPYKRVLTEVKKMVKTCTR